MVYQSLNPLNSVFGQYCVVLMRYHLRIEHILLECANLSQAGFEWQLPSDQSLRHVVPLLQNYYRILSSLMVNMAVDSVFTLGCKQRKKEAQGFMHVQVKNQVTEITEPQQK